MAAFSLASKSCESLRRTEQIIRSMLAASKREKTSSEDLSKISNELEVVEGFMAMTLGYDFKVSHPEKFIDAVFDQRIPNGEFSRTIRQYPGLILFLHSPRRVQVAGQNLLLDQSPLDDILRSLPAESRRRHLRLYVVGVWQIFRKLNVELLLSPLSD